MLVAQNIKVKTFLSYCFSPVRNLCPLNMENINNFLKSSTIHGLSYIATNRKFVKLFWIIVVITGFTCASILIHQSFEDWYESPVKTTEEASANACFAPKDGKTAEKKQTINNI